jgi:hypothetical protein
MNSTWSDSEGRTAGLGKYIDIVRAVLGVADALRTFGKDVGPPVERRS